MKNKREKLETYFTTGNIVPSYGMKKLPEYYQFNIEIRKIADNFEVVFTDTKGVILPSYKERLTPSQWNKARCYLNRKLIPFCGYVYQVKQEYKSEAVYKIK
jgi:hypothetical protein